MTACVTERGEERKRIEREKKGKKRGKGRRKDRRTRKGVVQRVQSREGSVSLEATGGDGHFAFFRAGRREGRIRFGQGVGIRYGVSSKGSGPYNSRIGIPTPLRGPLLLLLRFESGLFLGRG